jgi:membrane dipeptidase
MRRRTFVSAAATLAAMRALEPYAAYAQPKALSYADMHSHIGLLGGRAKIRDAMTPNGMLVVCRKIVADGPVIRRFPGKGVKQVREPAAGELSSRFERVLARVRSEHQAEAMHEIIDTQGLQRVMSESQPAVVIGSEGGDFLEGDITRLEAARREGLVHLQLVHYRVSELGDISTDLPVHDGLTAFGKQVVSACNRLGILVDVAHCTSEGIAQALEISTRPMIYSHGHVTSTAPHWTQSGVRARAVSARLARTIAGKGGVIGLWPLGYQFRTLDAYARGLLDLVESLGAAHVGVGTDMFGLGGSTAMPGYAQFPELEELLVKRGMKSDEVKNVLGANYLRVLGAALAA